MKPTITEIKRLEELLEQSPRGHNQEYFESLDSLYKITEVADAGLLRSHLDYGTFQTIKCSLMDLYHVNQNELENDLDIVKEINCEGLGKYIGKL